MEEDDEDDEEEESKSAQGANRDDSSSDDNDSTAAAHAAAIGHSPQPIKILPPGAESAVEAEDGESKEHESQDTEMKDASMTESPEKQSSVETKSASQPPENGGPETEETKEAAKEEDSTPMEGVEKMEESGTPAGAEQNGSGDTKPVLKKKLQRNPIIHLNERDEDENTALHIAILARKLDHVKLLLEAGASFRMRSDGSFPLHTAISIGAIADHRQFAYECVVLLHESGADLTAKDDSVHTPLYLACMSNLPQIASYILSDSDGLSTLNTRADRAGNRPLHAAAKYDTLDNASLSKTAVASATGQLPPGTHHHPDGSVVNSMHSIPGYSGKEMIPPETSAAEPPASVGAVAPSNSTEALMTQVLLGTTGIEIDAPNVMGRSPLHIACSKGNWPVARLLLQAGASTTLVDRRGYTPGQLAYKRGMPIPNDIVETLGDPPESGTVPPLRDLILDPNGNTLLICHELCLLHRTCPPIRRDSSEPPPENVRRLHVLVDQDSGILRTGEFGSLVWKNEARRAAISDVLKVRSIATRLSPPSVPNLRCCFCVRSTTTRT